MAVQDRLAVFDAIGQPASGHRLPAFSLSQFPGGTDDDLASLGSLACAALLFRHMLSLSLLEELAG
jgi:hypothetical protein